MDTRFFVSREEFHNVQMDVRQLHAVQASQMERLLRLEKRHQDDAAIRSAWSTSPFPSALVGTPQQVPVRIPSTEAFDLDEQSQTLGSLHLEPDDEPIRRAAAASRANSVRFDESANVVQSARHFSSDMGPFRPGSSLMMERSLSHKSDGRHSSAGHSVHSVHSMASGRGSSLALDTTFLTGDHSSDDSPIDMPEQPPVFYVLGSVPAIVRCWLTKDFANNTLLYAAICTGAQKSTVDFSLLKDIGLVDLIYRDLKGTHKIHLQIYLAEAIPATKAADSIPQIPYLAIDFEVVGINQAAAESSNDCHEKKAIRVFVGSDALRVHSADVLFSRNILSVYSAEREKLTVPFVRPEDDAMFKNLCTTSVTPEKTKLNATAAEFISSDLKSRDSVSGMDDEAQPQQSEQGHDQDERLGSQGHGRGEDDDEDDVDVDNDGDDDEDEDDEDDEAQLINMQRQGKGQRQRQRQRQRPRLVAQERSAAPPPLAVSANGYADSPTASSPTSAPPLGTTRWPGPLPENVGGPGAVRSQGENEGGHERQPRNSTSSEFSGKDFSGKEATASGTESSGRRDASAIWGSWRQGSSTAGSDGGHRESIPLSGYQPPMRQRTMKVLKPKAGSGSSSARTGPAYEPALLSRSSADNRRKSQGLANEGGAGAASGSGGGISHGSAPSNVIRWESKRSISSSNAAINNAGLGKESKGQQQGLAALELRNNSTSTSAPRSSNPVGGASAFAWMNTGKPKTPTTAE